MYVISDPNEASSVRQKRRFSDELVPPPALHRRDYCHAAARSKRNCEFVKNSQNFLRKQHLFIVYCSDDLATVHITDGSAHSVDSHQHRILLRTQVIQA